MGTFTVFIMLLLILVLGQCAAIHVHFIDAPQKVSRRTYSEHWHLRNPVRNCTDPQWTMEVLNATNSVSIADCHKVLENTRHNKGYYEVWSFDGDDYTPLTGFQSCVMAVSRMNTVVPGGYAVVGNDDVVSAIVEAIKNHRSGNVSAAAGVWDCGPNSVTLSLIVYNGLQGYNGSRNAPVVDMHGDWAPTASESIGAPTVTDVPTETPTRYGRNSSHETQGPKQSQRF